MSNKENCATCCQEEQVAYEHMPVQVKIDLLGRLITAITLVTEHAESEEYCQLQENEEELEELSSFLPDMLSGDKLATVFNSCCSNNILALIKKNSEQLKLVSSSEYITFVQEIAQGKHQEFPELPTSFKEHPVDFYAQLLHSFVDTQFFPLDQKFGEIVTKTFEYCCQKLYTASLKVEEMVVKQQINNIVDCMWNFALLEKNKNEIIYVLGGWRFASMMVILEELREKYSDQSLDNLDDRSMLKLIEALSVGSSFDSEDEDEENDEDDEDEDDEEDDDCCHHGCCGKR